MKIDIRPLDCKEKDDRKQYFSILNSRLYVTTAGETILENLMNRHSRPHNLYRKVVVPAIVKEFKNRSVKCSDFSWSQYSGCSCGCSPGFKFTTVEACIPKGYNVYVTIEPSDFEGYIRHVQSEFQF